MPSGPTVRRNIPSGKTAAFKKITSSKQTDFSDLGDETISSGSWFWLDFYKDDFMPQTFPAVTLHAANSNPGGTTSTHSAIHNLITLMAKAHVNAAAKVEPANDAEPASKQEKSL